MVLVEVDQHKSKVVHIGREIITLECMHTRHQFVA